MIQYLFFGAVLGFVSYKSWERVAPHVAARQRMAVATVLAGLSISVFLYVNFASEEVFSSNLEVVLSGAFVIIALAGSFALSGVDRKREIQ